ncbi:MAG: hypothetical protein H8D78_14255 [Chloroflexi bacterium]|nr:hypothetical protein [Chloroflexota bacterium]
MNPFQSLRNYEEFVYTLKQRFTSVQRSTLIVVKRGKRTAVVQGEITFAQGYRVTLKERLSFDEGPVVIEDYGYELWRHADRIAWYDSQPHPDDPSLGSTYPHHKHIPPDIKHHRVPTPDMSFQRPNLPALIREIEEMLKG